MNEGQATEKTNPTPEAQPEAQPANNYASQVDFSTLISRVSSLESRFSTVESRVVGIIETHIPELRNAIASLEGTLKAVVVPDAQSMASEIMAFVETKLSALENWAKGLPLPDHAKFVPPVQTDTKPAG